MSTNSTKRSQCGLSTGYGPSLGFHLLLRLYEDRPTIDVMTSEETDTTVRKQDAGGCLEMLSAAVPKQNSNSSGNMNLERILNLTSRDTDTVDNLSTHHKYNIEVILLTATRLPGRQSKVVKAQVSNIFDSLVGHQLLSERSYLTQITEGQVYRRNRKHFRATNEYYLRIQPVT